MKDIPLYSIVIFPTPEQTALIKSYKQLLKNHIGWYGSTNAAAHITVISIKDEFMLSLYLDLIKEFCKNIEPQNVTLNKWNSFAQHTFFLEPNETAHQYLNQIIIDLHQYLGFKIKTAHTHLTIARELDVKKMKIAYELFQSIEVNFEFCCDAIYLRKFNYQTKQYSDIIEKISFGK